MRELEKFILAILAAVMFSASAAVASSRNIEHRIQRGLEVGAFERVVKLSRELLDASPDEPQVLYAKASALAMLGERDDAAATLERAIHAGFRDFTRMRQDGNLASIRDHDTFLAIVAASQEASRKLAHQALEQWLEQFGEDNYYVEHDEHRGLIFATALRGGAHQQVRRMLEKQQDHLSDTLFGAPPDYDVLIAIPTSRDARRLFQQRNIGGSYEHRSRRLVSRDIGGSLRHEFFHVMHYGHMERLGQAHRLWVQEGLASLYEDYELTDNGVQFLPNERDEITRNRARVNRLVPWHNVFELPADRFMARATVLYPQTRSMFQFVAAEGKLEAWYEAYVEHFDDDPSGKRAFEVAFGQSIDRTEQQWRQWIEDQPVVRSTRIEQGRASLGIGTVPQGALDGVLITQILPGSSASTSDLLVGDVLVAVDGQSITTLGDIRRVMNSRVVGDNVEIRVRRGEMYDTFTMRLQPLSHN